MIARYVGRGSPLDAAAFEPVPSPVRVPFPEDGSEPVLSLIAPGNQRWYSVAGGRLVEMPANPYAIR